MRFLLSQIFGGADQTDDRADDVDRQQDVNHTLILSKIRGILFSE